MAVEQLDQLVTIGDIASRLGVQAARVKYVVETRSIRPDRRIGLTRVWRVGDIPRIAAALANVRGRTHTTPAEPVSADESAEP